METEVKILFIGQCGVGDYQQDTILHGLKSLLGTDVVDVPKIEYMYSSYGDTSKLYGRGFTLFGLLPDESCDREDIVAKLRNRYFDLVVYGSIRRSRQYRHHVIEHMHPAQIVCIDGEDDQSLFPSVGWRFKRELREFTEGYLPIQFSIPEEKIVGPLEKLRTESPLEPMDRSTYIYDTEKDYYEQYQHSYFAWTQRKAGWDCMRHYEILACGCVPLFRDLGGCPESTMVHYPKASLKEAYNRVWNLDHETDRSILGEFSNTLVSYLRDKLTTKAMARYLLDTVTK